MFSGGFEIESPEVMIKKTVSLFIILCQLLLDQLFLGNF